jgi:DNA-binding NarL/FixJ family response regulator
MKSNRDKQPRLAPAKGDVLRPTIRTFVLDDDPFTLAALTELILKGERIEIVGAATDGRTAFQPAAMTHPDLVLIEVQTPGLDAMHVIGWLKQLQNPPAVFVVTSADNRGSQTGCLASGAEAFLLKTVDLSAELQVAIHKFVRPRSRKEKPERRSAP